VAFPCEPTTGTQRGNQAAPRESRQKKLVSGLRPVLKHAGLDRVSLDVERRHPG
jgi:hypothetical protein